MSEKLRAHLLLLGVVAVWGSTFVLVKDALSDISPLLFNLVRMALATVCLAVVYRKHLRQLTSEALAGGAVAGFFLAVGYQFQTAGLALTTPSKSAFLTGLTVIIVPLLSVVPGLRVPGSAASRLERLRWGAGCTRGNHADDRARTVVSRFVISCTASDTGTGIGINLGDCSRWAAPCRLPFICSRWRTWRDASRLNSLHCCRSAFCTLVMAVSSPILEHPRFHLTARLVVALLVASVLATAAAFTIQSWAQQHLAATHTALILSAEPLFAWITSLLFLHQGLNGRQAFGALLILAGIGLTELFTASVFRPRSALPLNCR